MTEEPNGITPSGDAMSAFADLRQFIGARPEATPQATEPTPQRATNRELLDQARNARTNSDRSRAAELLRRRIRSLCAVVVDRHTSALTAQEVDDLTQEVILRLLQSREGVDPTAAYIARVATNLLIDQRRFLNRRGLGKVGVSLEESPEACAIEDPGPSIEEDVLTRMAHDELRAALRNALRPVEADVVWLRTEGASHPEIAAALGIQPANARKHCERGLKRLKSLAEAGRLPAALAV